MTATSKEIAADVIQRQWRRHGVPFKDREHFQAAVKREMEHRGLEPIAAVYGLLGHCTVCQMQETRCCGWHLKEEGAKPPEPLQSELFSLDTAHAKSENGGA